MKSMIKIAAMIAIIQGTFGDAAGQSRNPLFTLMDPKHTHVVFENDIRENDSLNVLRYEYLYNGAGVGIGDFNQDGLPDIFLSSNTGSNKLFINHGGFTFEDVTSAAHVAGNCTWSTGVSVADVNGDGLPDIYVCHSGKFDDPQKLRNELFINAGSKNGVPVFTEMAADYGLDAPGTQSTQAAFFDYDNDGDLDMFLLDHSNNQYDPFINTSNIRSRFDSAHGNRLFRNDSQNGHIHFTDVTRQAGIVNNPLNFGLSVTISDINKDGWPDIYTTSDYSEKDCYYVNNKDGTFTESLQRSFGHISKYSMGADIADYNNDGRPDVFTLDMLPEDNHRQKLLKGPDDYDQYHLLVDSGFYYQQMRNMLQLNQGNDPDGHARFSEIAQLAGVSNTDWSWSGLFADFDNDGWKDLLVTNGYLRDYTNMDFLKFAVADAKIAAAKQGNQNFQTYDLVRQMPSNKLANYIFQNNGDLTFTNKSKDWGFNKLTVSNAAAYADFDNDGAMDLIICNNNEPVMLYRNNAATQLSHHYLRIRLKGKGMNTAAYGAKIDVITPGTHGQYQELFPVRGYQSTVTQEILFGVAAQSVIDTVIVTWPDGKQSILNHVKADQALELSEADTNDHSPGRQPSPHHQFSAAPRKTSFTDVSKTSGIDFVHKPNDLIDFKSEPLLPYQLSRQGPALATADVNGDGLDDVFLGGDMNQPSVLYLQKADGSFTHSPSQPWGADSACENVNAVFFDANNDGHPDLYVVSGGNVYQDNSPEYRDRLYINDGTGNFSKIGDALPLMTSSKCAIAVGDYDHDGLPDLFVGGRGKPGSFPEFSRSYLLHNDSRNGVVRFSDVTETVCPALQAPGMVTAAAFADIDHDGFPELLIAGDWMPVMFFANHGGKLENSTVTAGLKNLNGMWASITPTDVNHDGRMDFVLGNCGYNNQFRASPRQPMTMYAKDFDDDGLVDPITCYYIGGTSYPMASKDELLDQIPSLKKKYVHYADYADATVTDIFGKEKLADAAVLICDQLATGILYNAGESRFDFRPLPLQAQFSKVYAALTGDFDGDGTDDILIAGNFFPYRSEFGKDDASLGLLLKGTGSGVFNPVEPADSGCFIDGDVRNMVRVKTAAGYDIVIAKNGQPVQVLKHLSK